MSHNGFRAPVPTDPNAMIQVCGHCGMPYVPRYATEQIAYCSDECYYRAGCFND